MRGVLAKLDDVAARAERLLVLAALAVMAAAVFLDVVQRVASTPDGMILRLLTALVGGNPSESLEKTLRQVGVPSVAALLAYGFFFAALRSAAKLQWPARKAAVGALFMTIAAALLLLAVLWIFPNGLVWSQPLALGLLLWVAILGATLVTKARGHIVLEIADKVWPQSLLPFARLASGLVAAAFCAGVTVLSMHYVADFFAQWSHDDVGYMSGLRLPKWCVYAALPTGFALMAARFAAYAIGDFLARGEAEVAS